jgi:hypothetical protein
LGATVPNSPDLSHLLARLDRLEADNADLREQLDVPPTTTRRNLLRGATVAAGAAGLGLLSARPAAAANPGVFLNQDNPGTSLTTISGGTNSGPLKVVGNVGAYGVRGQCNGSSGYAVYGETDLGYAVVGDSTSGVDLLARGNGILSQQANNRPGPPTSGAHDNGEMTRDKSGGMWLCTADGTPGTWRRVVALPPGAQGGAYVALDHPIRLLDTRPGKTANNAGVGIRTNGSTTAVAVSGLTYDGVTIPANVAMVIGNLTVVSPAGAGYVTVYPHGKSKPIASNLNYVKSVTLANAFTAGVGTNQIDVTVSGNACNLIIDIVAFVI